MKVNYQNILKIHYPWLLWLLMVLILTGIPGTFIPKVPNIADLFSPDKIVHFIMFGGLTFLLMRSFLKQFPERGLRKSVIIYCLICGIIIGALTEVMQHYIFIGRNGNYVDFIADVIGSFVGLGILFIQKQKK